MLVNTIIFLLIWFFGSLVLLFRVVVVRNLGVSLAYKWYQLVLTVSSIAEHFVVGFSEDSL